MSTTIYLLGWLVLGCAFVFVIADWWLCLGFYFCKKVRMKQIYDPDQKFDSLGKFYVFKGAPEPDTIRRILNPAMFFQSGLNVRADRFHDWLKEEYDRLNDLFVRDHRPD